MNSSETFNFNPGTLAVTSKGRADQRLRRYQYDPHLSPLAQYQNANKQIDDLRFKINSIWKSNLNISIIHSATTFSTLLSFALALENDEKYIVLTSQHEHFGGIKAFQNLPKHYKIIYLKDEELATLDNFLNAIEIYKPDILFLSHVCYDTGWEFPISKYGEIFKKFFPGSIFIVDVAQSLGLVDLPETTCIDIMFGSSHKWLVGPQGMGILWTSDFFKNRVKSIYLLMGDSENSDDGFTIAGGRDFSSYSSMLNALNEYHNIGLSSIEEKTRELSDYFWKLINVCLGKFNINCKRMNNMRESLFKPAPFLVLCFERYNPYDLYTEMNNDCVHVKCIMDCNVFGSKIHILRIGIQHFETNDRILKSINIIEGCLNRIQKRSGL